jgi:glutamine synthetase
MDPFTADPTIIVFCDVYDIYKGQMYEKCPRAIAKKALEHLATAGVGDVAYFGPENEFFVFDDVRIRDEINCSYYEVDTEEGEWNHGKDFKEGYNTGHRPGTKGGYFPVAPIDTMVDLRAEMMMVLEQVGLEVVLGPHEVAQGQGEIGIVFGTLVEAADNVQKTQIRYQNGRSPKR